MREKIIIIIIGRLGVVDSFVCVIIIMLSLAE